jgi:hypothetical protein
LKSHNTGATGFGPIKAWQRSALDKAKDRSGEQQILDK